VIGHGQQGVGVGRQLYPDDVGLLVDHVIDEPGSWWLKPLWSWRHTCDVSSAFSDAIGRRHGISRVTFNHLACWLNIESTM
jgi:hypothetical protein